MRAASTEAMFPVAILAGGLATRMHPVTQTIPKSMIEVAGRPFIEHQLELLRAEGVKNVVLCVGHLGEMIEAHVGDGSRFGLSVRYSFDGEKLLGTGGALRRALPLLGQEFFVLYGDSYLEIAYASVQAAYRERGKAGADDGVSQRGPMGHQQCPVRRRRMSFATTSGIPPPT